MEVWDREIQQLPALGATYDNIVCTAQTLMERWRVNWSILCTSTNTDIVHVLHFGRYFLTSRYSELSNFYIGIHNTPFYCLSSRASVRVRVCACEGVCV